MRDRQKPKTIWGHVLMSKKMAMNSEHTEWNTHKKKFARAHILTRTSALRCTKLAKKSGDHQRIAVSRASCSPYSLQLKGNASRNWKIMLKITQAWRIWSAEKPLRAIYIHDRLQLTHLYTLACTHTDTQSRVYNTIHSELWKRLQSARKRHLLFRRFLWFPATTTTNQTKRFKEECN